MYKLLMWINKEYNNPPVIITENGVSDSNCLKDTGRVNYFNSYLSKVLDAMVSWSKWNFIIQCETWHSMNLFLGGWLQSQGLHCLEFDGQLRMASRFYVSISIITNEKLFFKNTCFDI